MHRPPDVAAVLDLVAMGFSDYEVARRSGVPRGTVWRWRRRGVPGQIRRQRDGCPRCGECRHDFGALPARDYVYLLGHYLGDGTILRNAGSFRLQICSDAVYPGVIDECCAALLAIRGRPPRARRHPVKRLVTITSSWKAWPCLFPSMAPDASITEKSSSFPGSGTSSKTNRDSSCAG
jgi:Homeodomain-like domain